MRWYGYRWAAVGFIVALLAVRAEENSGGSTAVAGSATNTNSELRPLALQTLPLGSIRPAGWLAQQLRIQAEGLSGHLDEFWPDLKDNAWIGGKRDGWERGPYWLDGVVPLAFLLDDARLKAKVQRWVDYILTHQQEDGWLGPLQGEKRQVLDPWPMFVLFKALTQYQEATDDARVIPAMQKCLRRIDRLLDEKPLFSWGKSRWADLVVSTYWLYDRTHEKWLLDLAAKAQRQGYNWRGHFADFRFKGKTAGKFDQVTHGVNTGMAIKEPGVWYRQTSDPRDRDAVFRAMQTLDTYHGQATGIFTCDEHLAGRDPSQGTELCTVVEYMYSLEVLLGILGEPSLGDRLEKIAFNALPATFKPDMCAHQYDQQANQVICKLSPERIFTDNGPDSNLFGLEPNFGCCTANMHQGWPKLTAHLWMKSSDDGLAAVAYVPCSVKTTVKGKPVQIDVRTDYPFDETVSVNVSVSEPTRFPVLFRIPGWADTAEAQVGDGKAEPAKAGTFHRVEREWRGGTPVTLRLPMPVRVRRGYRDSVSLERGPLVYALKVGADWKLLKGQPPFADWEVYPTTAWNYALELDVAHPEKSIRFEKRGLGKQPFSADGAPVQVTVKGRKVPAWRIEKNAAGPLPQSPVQSTEPLEELTLIPYGCTSLRVTEFPLLGR